jgi:predicted deacylase
MVFRPHNPGRGLPANIPVSADTLRIGTATAGPGEIASGQLEIPAGSDGATRVPLTIARGRKAGPTLALIAGTHGSEPAPIIALQRVRAQVDPAALSGTLLLVHVANLPSFLGRTVYYSPVDRRNLNRVYPGRADGTVSERIAFAITNEIIARADYLVDMHSGDGNEALHPYTYWSRLGIDPRVDATAREMALAWGFDHIVVDNDRPRDPAASVFTQNTAQLRGKPAITTEAGEVGVPTEAMIRLNERGALRMLRYLKMLPGPVEFVEHPIWFDRTAVLTAPATGIWYPLVERSQTVQGGTPLGRITDFFGNELAVVRVPFAGTILYVVATPAMTQGEPLGMVAHPMPESATP